MKDELSKLALGELKRDLPLGFQTIHVSDAVLDEGATSAITLSFSRYRHRSSFPVGLHKALSKPEL